MKVPFRRVIAWYLVAAMFIIGIAPRVDAGFAPSEIVVMQQVDRQADVAKIQKVLEMKAVQQRLHELGLTQDEITSRLSQLSDQQVHEFALQLDDIKTGADGLGIIIAVLVIIVLILVILHLTGHKVLVK